MLECTYLMKSYKKKTVVNNFSFRVNRGEVFAFLGSNGAGKTTTIKMILGLVGIDRGEVKLAPNISMVLSSTIIRETLIKSNSPRSNPLFRAAEFATLRFNQRILSIFALCSPVFCKFCISFID